MLNNYVDALNAENKNFQTPNIHRIGDECLEMKLGCKYLIDDIR